MQYVSNLARNVGRYAFVPIAAAALLTGCIGGGSAASAKPTPTPIPDSGAQFMEPNMIQVDYAVLMRELAWPDAKIFKDGVAELAGYTLRRTDVCRGVKDSKPAPVATPT